jgi:hypothetical protein
LKFPQQLGPAATDIGGTYINVGEHSAEVRLTPMPLSANSYFVSGASVFSTGPQRGATGEIDFVADLKKDSLEFSRPEKNGTYKLVLKFEGDRLIVTEESPDDTGLKFYLQGSYKKAP